MTTDDALRELAPQLRRYASRPNSIFGEPAVLKRMCALFGFKNDCRQGHVYITDAKLARLHLPPATETLPEKWGGVPPTLEEDHAQARHDRSAGITEPPAGPMLAYPKMTGACRAAAALLALKAGWRAVGADWQQTADGGSVLVSVPGVGQVWSVVRLPMDGALAEIETRFGPDVRARVEEAIG